MRIIATQSDQSTRQQYIYSKHAHTHACMNACTAQTLTCKSLLPPVPNPLPATRPPLLKFPSLSCSPLLSPPDLPLPSSSIPTEKVTVSFHRTLCLPGRDKAYTSAMYQPFLTPASTTIPLFPPGEIILSQHSSLCPGAVTCNSPCSYCCRCVQLSTRRSEPT